MTRPQSATMMDAVFSSSDEDAKGRLLKIMQGFLISECEKHATLQKGTHYLLLILPNVFDAYFRQAC